MPEVQLFQQDCFQAFSQLDDQSVHVVITDPPYFLDKLKDNWESEIIDKGKRKIYKSATVESLPGGMKFDPQQGAEFEAFSTQVAEQAWRVLKPGGFFLSFSAPRLFHRLGIATEKAGFNIRDMWAWLYTQNQAKAMSVKRFLQDADIPDDLTRQELEEILSVWKTPQIKSCLEPLVCAQKPPEGTFLNNWLKHRVGLINTNAKVGQGEMFPANVISSEAINSAFDRVFLVPKPSKEERGPAVHVSIKPLALMLHLVRLTAMPGQTVLDPFSGTGTTGLAALAQDCNYIGFELNPEYFSMSMQRFEQFFADSEINWQQRSETIMTSSL